MQINHDIFVSWLEKHFDKIKVRGNQIQVNSIFTNDNKLKLYLNTKLNAFHDFKEEKSGNLIEFIQYLENCSYDEAIEILGGQREIHNLEEKVKQLFKAKKEIETKITSVELPQSTYLINDLTVDNPFRIRAEKYLRSRKIENHNLMVCCSGKAMNRIIIPYYSKDKKLVYWNARYMGNHSQKYMFPEGISKPLYSLKWEDDNRAIVVEGELDSITLSQCGFFSIACGGKEITESQRKDLKNLNLVLAFDNDKAGRVSLVKRAKILASDNAHRKISYCICPNPIKDWNEFLNKENETAVIQYITDNEQPFDEVLFKTKFYKDF